jgi:hypothetical protein
MLRRAPWKGHRREHFCRKSLPCLVGLTRGGCLPVTGRFRPSQWREGAGTCAGLSGEWVLCVAPTAASGGRLNSASSLGDPSPFPLRGDHCGPRCPVWFAGPSPGPGDFPQARRGPPAESAVEAGLGRGVAGAYVGALVRPAAGREYSGDWESSPARSRRPFHRGLLRVGVRVGLLMPKATEGLFKLDAGFAPAARSAVAKTESWGLLASESIQRPVPVQPQVPKPRRCASTPTRLIELAPSGTSRDGRVTRVVRVSAGHIGRCRVCSVRCRRVLSPTSPPQDGSGRRRALHMPNSVGSMCQTARGTKQWDLHALTGRRAGGGVGLARSVESM